MFLGCSLDDVRQTAARYYADHYDLPENTSWPQLAELLDAALASSQPSPGQTACSGIWSNLPTARYQGPTIHQLLAFAFDDPHAAGATTASHMVVIRATVPHS